MVEDEANARSALLLLLEDEGHEVMGAGDGIEALEVLDGWLPDVVLTDVQMPRLDGVALMDELHRRLPDVPVIVMTAFGSIEHAVETLRLGAADYLQKPIDLDRVVSAIRRVITHTDRELGPGDRVAGRYQIEAVIGEGAMGVVYRATHLHLGREVALKVLSGRHDLPESRARFLREAQVAASLRHPNVVQIHDFGSDRGIPYLVMELLEGCDMRAAIEGSGWTDERALRIAVAVAGVLVETHRIGLVHRDLKPENVFLERAGERENVRVLDFGIAVYEAGDDDGDGDKEGTVVGTPFYIAPEQAAGILVGPPADIYSFGCLLYEMFAGQPPFVGSAVEVMSSHLYEAPARPSERGAAISPRLEALIVGMMHKVPKWRPTASQVEAELRAIARESDVLLDVIAELPTFPHELTVLAVGEIEDELVTSLARQGIRLERARQVSDQLGRVSVIYAADCSLSAIRELVATDIPVVATLERGDHERSVRLRELGVAARIARPVGPTRLAVELARVVRRRRDAQRITTLRLSASPRAGA
ncbi:MAG: protein kinase [Nannocystaceae bacterium]